jgi:hypothetical protein
MQGMRGASRALECGGLPPLSEATCASVKEQWPAAFAGLRKSAQKAAASCRTPRRRCAPLERRGCAALICSQSRVLKLEIDALKLRRPLLFPNGKLT